MANQYRILAALYRTEKKSYEEKAEALECGYELHYDDPNVYEETLSKDQCREVLDVLNMYDQLRMSAKAAGIKAEKVAFAGYDGNNETSYMAYAQYFCKQDDGRFTELTGRKGYSFNSHSPLVTRYRAMLREWTSVKAAKGQSAGGWVPFTKPEIEKILNAQ